jgi:hypothetical protein
MAGEIPRVVGVLSRTASGAISGAPGGHVLYALIHQGQWSSGRVSAGRHEKLPASRMRDFWGDGRVEGSVSIEGEPASRKVRLFDGLTGLLIDETWSAQNGQYRFDFIDPSREYFVLAHDYGRQFNAVIADWVTPEPTVYP